MIDRWPLIDSSVGDQSSGGERLMPGGWRNEAAMEWTGGVTLKRFFAKFTVSMGELDATKLREFCSGIEDVIPMESLVARADAAVVGEITSLRIVPHSESPWLEATISDGTGTLVELWTGRRRIAGLSPGRRILVRGRAAPTANDRRLTVYNPAYELL